ncbi:MAG: zinc ribbon domain-containing protein [Clostridia bacterium]|nr:zinc ribbon domain-containing protein [Clostridia bacterium]
MLCQRCQTPLPEGEEYCPMCGAPSLGEETQLLTPEDMPRRVVVVPEEPVKKPKPIGWIVAAIIGLVAIVVAVVVLFMMNGKKTGLQDTWKVSLRMDQFVELAKKEIAAGQNVDAFSGMYPGMDIEAMMDIFDVEEPLTVYVTFDKDDSCALHLNLEETESFMQTFFDRMLVFLQNDGYYQIMEAQGISRAEVDEMLAEMDVDMNTLLLMLSMSKSQLNASAMETAFVQMGMKTDGNGNVKLFETTYRYEDGMLSFAPFLGGKVDEKWSVNVAVNGNTLEIGGDLDEATREILSVITIERAALPR